MTFRFSDMAKQLELLELGIDYCYDHLVAVGKQGKNPGELGYPSCVAIDSSNNQIYVTEGDPPRVSIFSETGRFLNTFSDKLMRRPYGIAIHKDNIYVTDSSEHSVLQFKVAVDICLVARLGREGSRIGQFDSPKQLTICTLGNVYVTDCNNNRVQILSEGLHYQRHISHHSMTRPYDIKLTDFEVCVLTANSPCVHIFKYSGEKIRSLIKSRDIGMHIFYSYSFCLDADKNFIISDPSPLFTNSEYIQKKEHS